MSDPTNNHHSPERYEIWLEGHIPESRSNWFAGMSIEHDAEGKTILRGEIVDQSALHGLLNKIRDLNIPLLLVKKRDKE